MCYKLGDYFTVEKSYVSDVENGICIYAPGQMPTLLSTFLKEVSARILGKVSNMM